MLNWIWVIPWVVALISAICFGLGWHFGRRKENRLWIDERGREHANHNLERSCDDVKADTSKLFELVYELDDKLTTFMREAK